MANEIHHIIILVAGTAEPICVKTNNRLRALNYEKHSQSQSYWSGNNQTLVKQLNALCAEYANLSLFDQHGWSGDNTRVNREIAGAYLADRLCGSNGENAYYARYLNKKVAFHLIGHSHGGNVLNEFTKRAADAEQWPATWKIQTVTYLSTPFFKYQHQLDTRVFSPSCKVINVSNEFDLTQRIIADLSLADLVSAYQQASKELPNFSQTLSKIKQYNLSALVNGLSHIFHQQGVLQWLFNSASVKFSNKQGQVIYQQAIDLISQLIDLLEEVTIISGKLATSIHHPVSEQVNRLIYANRRYFINQELHQKILKLSNSLTSELDIIRLVLQQRQNIHDYRITPLIAEIKPALESLMRVFSFDKKTAIGPIFDLCYLLIENQIEVFDNTSVSPIRQLNIDFKKHLLEVDISMKDPFYHQGNSEGFTRFIKKLERAECQYEHDTSNKNLLNLCLTLLSSQPEYHQMVKHMSTILPKLDQVLGVKKLSVKRWFLNSLTLRGKLTPSIKLALQFQQQLQTYLQVMQSFTTPSLVTKNSAENQPTVGSLQHFTMTSHAISKQCLPPEVALQLTQFFRQYSQQAS